MEVPIKHKYVSILRCRTYCVWPEWREFISPPVRASIRIYNEVIDLFISVHVVTYEHRPRPELSAPNPEKKLISPILWRGTVDTGYWVGPCLLKSPDELITIGFNHERALQGEIDIQLHIAASAEIPIDQLTNAVSPLPFSLISYINIVLGDFLIPVTPMQVWKFGESGTAEVENLIKINVRNRKSFSEDLLQDTILSFLGKRSNLSEKEGKAFDVAARRYLSSVTEEDPIDRYCDLWESCEFITSGFRVRGDVVSRIAQVLAWHIKWQKSAIENKLQIRKLYQIRKDLIHNAVENLKELEQHTTVLEKIAFELIRFRIGLPYKECNILDKLLRESH